MKVFKNRVLIKIIASICLFLALLNFGSSTKVYANDDDLGWGGVLINPITSLMTAIGDAIMEILHDSIQEQRAAIIKVTGHEEWWEKMSTVIAIVAAIIAVVVIAAVVIIATGGAAAGAAALAGGAAKAAFIAGATKAAGTAALIGIAGGTVAGFATKAAMIPKDMYVPAFSMTAEKIFSNQIHIFDVNFFRTGENAKKYEIYKDETRTETVTKTDQWINETYGETQNQKYEYLESGIISYDNFGGTRYTVYQAEKLKPLFQKLNDKFGGTIIPYNEEDTTSWILCSNVPSDNQSWSDEKGSIFTSTFEGYVNIYDENDEQIFYVTYIRKYNTYEKGDVASSYTEELRVDILKDGNVNVTESNLVQVQSTAQQLRGIISTWYFVLRNVALLVLMLLLIYSGIRIVIGSTAGEKAKYKERIMDWLVAICLVMIMHYIMVFAVELVETIVDFVSATSNGNYLYLELTDVQEKNAQKVLKDFNTIGNAKNKDGEVGKGAIAYYDENGNRLAEHGVLIWHTDLAGLFRIQAQLTEEGTGKWVAYSFCYVVLVLFTLFFAFTYIKRVIYMAFLTMIAPLVAMTYPFDKITDGKAQAFDSWLKEYIFNLMIQPLHLLLYSILVSSAYMLASENPIYALVAIGFMMPAEKLMRKFFGFEKAKTPGLLGGAAGAAIAMSGLQGLLKHKPHGGKSDGGNGKSGDANKVRFSNKNKGNAMDDMTGMKPGQGGNTTQNVKASQTGNVQDSESNSQANKQEWDSRLTPEQKDEMMAEGIAPGDAEYDGYLKQYGLDANSSEETLDEDDILANTTLGSEDWDHDGFGSENVGDGPEVASSEVAETSANEVAADNETGTQQGHKRSIMRAIGVASLGVGKQAAAGILRGVHPLRFAGKVAAGATAATAGLLIGTASGDPSKAFQYTTAGAMAGSALASSLSGRKGLDGEKIKQDYEMAYYGPDYKEKLIERQKKEFQTSSENISYLQQVMGVSRSEAKQILESTGSECFNNGITDIKDVATIHQLTHANSDAMSFKKAAAARTYAKRRLGGADADQMTDDQVREYQARWSKEFQERYKITRQQADDLARQSFDAAIKFNKTYSGLTKR